MPTAGPSCSSTAESSRTPSATASNRSPTSAKPRDFRARLTELGAAKRKVLYDKDGSAEAVARLVEAAGGTIVEGADPVALPRAKKSAAELAGSRAAHLRDGVAMHALPPLHRGGAGRLADRDRRGEGAGAAAQRDRRGRRRAARGRLLRDDLLHRPERARSTTIASPSAPTARSNPASSISSIPARSTATAPPTSRARF